MYTFDGGIEWILVHVEVQEKYRPDFGNRMFEYFYRILDKYNRRITAWVILTENNTISRSPVFQMEYLGTSLRYQFNLYKIATQNEEELLQSNNPFALVTLAAKTAFVSSGKNRDQQLLEAKLLIIRNLLKASWSKGKVRKIMNFLRYYTKFEKEETENIFNTEIAQLTNNTTTMGIEELLIARAKHYGKLEGEALGEENKSRIMVENLITDFGFTDEQAAKAAVVTIDFVKNIRAGLKTRK